MLLERNGESRVRERREMKLMRKRVTRRKEHCKTLSRAEGGAITASLPLLIFSFGRYLIIIDAPFHDSIPLTFSLFLLLSLSTLYFPIDYSTYTLYTTAFFPLFFFFFLPKCSFSRSIWFNFCTFRLIFDCKNCPTLITVNFIPVKIQCF